MPLSRVRFCGLLVAAESRREDDMKTRRMVIAIGVLIAAACLVLQGDAARATNGNKCPKLGYCPPGSCAQDGSARACNSKNCSPHNCRH